MVCLDNDDHAFKFTYIKRNTSLVISRLETITTNENAQVFAISSREI